MFEEIRSQKLFGASASDSGLIIDSFNSKTDHQTQAAQTAILVGLAAALLSRGMSKIRRQAEAWSNQRNEAPESPVPTQHVGQTPRICLTDANYGVLCSYLASARLPHSQLS